MQTSPLEDWSSVFGLGKYRVLVKRDDLLPFPLAGNKFRKLTGELRHVDPERHAIITVGAVHSNHCRTAAMLAAQRGIPIHCVLHAEAEDPERAILGRRMLDALGARSVLVDPTEIKRTVSAVSGSVAADGRKPYVIEGGCHTLGGVNAYIEAVEELACQMAGAPDFVFLASGTGATQAGIAVGCKRAGWRTQVIGVSVAREQERGRRAVEEAARWVCDNGDLPAIDFTDEFRAGGYGQGDDRTRNSVANAWRHGLPVDPVYTGKALACLNHFIDQERLPSGATIVFWHTGGLFQAITGPLS